MNSDRQSAPASASEVEEAYAQWQRQKQAIKAPDDLTDAVMQALPMPGEEGPASKHRGIADWRSIVDMPLARAAVFMIAALLGMGRYALLLFCFIAS